jgi:hypothetical protein
MTGIYVFLGLVVLVVVVMFIAMCGIGPDE